MTKRKTKPPRLKNAEASPNAFMRARRPERFSDSVVDSEPNLDRSLLEYCLSTITSRSQETAFATFARRLAELEICPNLLPQTGPTGGGDSKVDSETYPVAQDLALGWFVGMSGDAASQRWAFAFSAKKRWKDKAISDVNKAAATGRRYAKVFFITNQFVPDKARSEVEDLLSNAHKIDVRILDLTWILDRVFSNHHEELAIEHLQIATSSRPRVRKGPRDLEREQQLQEIEQRIQSTLASKHKGLQLVEDCIDVAKIARALEHPRTQVEGLFQRAERIAAKWGTSHQQLKSAYYRAWTAFWWYEDFGQFNELYTLVEKKATRSDNVYDQELLSNLWTLLHSTVKRGQLATKRSRLVSRTKKLATKLRQISKQEARPSAALHARALLLHMQLVQNLLAHDAVDSVFREFQEVLLHCEGLIGFPLEPFIDILIEIGDLVGDKPAYNQLFETVLAVQTSRKGEIAGARMLLTRGSQQLRSNEPYDAIRTLGLSLTRLYKHESRAEAVRALYFLGCACERVGLLWAARGTLLSAASVATNELWTHGDVTFAQAVCYRRLKWLELQLGRVPQALAWHETDIAVRRALVERGADKKRLSEGEIEFDASLGLLLLRADAWGLKQLSALPDTLDRLGLFSASAALLYALGYEEHLQQNFFPNNDKDLNIHEFFLKVARATRRRGSTKRSVPLRRTDDYSHLSRTRLRDYRQQQ